MKTMPRVRIITGPVDSGKTTALKKAVRRYVSEGLTVGGVIAEAVMEKGGKTGYQGIDIRSGIRRILVSTRRLDSGKRLGKFYISESAFASTGAGFLECLGCDVLVIDEIGPLELRGEGYAPFLPEILRLYKGILVLVVRKHILDDVIGTFALEDGIDTVEIYPVSGPDAFSPWS